MRHIENIFYSFVTLLASSTFIGALVTANLFWITDISTIERFVLLFACFMLACRNPLQNKGEN